MGLTDDRAAARRIGWLVASSDFAGVLNVIGATTSERQKAAALTNAALDVFLATGLLVLAERRSGGQRIAAAFASSSVWFGVGAWLLGARGISTEPT